MSIGVSPDSTNRTCVFIVDGITSHVFASMGVARRLIRRNYHVEFWGRATNPTQDVIRRCGFTYRTIQSLWSRYCDEIRLPTHLSVPSMVLHPQMLLEKLAARRAFMVRLNPELDVCEASLDYLLAEVRPAFVVMDVFLLAYYPLVWARARPVIVLSTKPLPAPDALVPPNDSMLLPRKSPWGRARVWLAWLRRKLDYCAYRAAQETARMMGAYTYRDLLREAARRSHFTIREELVRRWIQPDLHFKSLMEWALWVPETDLPRRAPLPPNAFYIGPSVDTSRSEAPWVRTKGTGMRRLIYIAVGTVRFRWKDNLPFLRKAIAAFAGLEGVAVVVSTGDERATRLLGEPPAGVMIFDFVPQLQILQVADLAVTHAGSGTFRECVHFRVPMLAYPRNHDQMGNSARIVFHGIGLRGDWHRDSIEVIRGKGLRILREPSFRCNLARLHEASERVQERLLTNALDALLGLQEENGLATAGSAHAAMLPPAMVK
jgi:zeaxanthin glucosyltransferase